MKAETTSASPDPEDRWNLRSDGEPGVDGHLGSFRRAPAVFSVYQVSPVPHRFTPGPAEYLVDVDDGVGPRECCRFTDDPEDVPDWNGRWNGDEWCTWILEQARARIADPETD